MRKIALAQLDRLFAAIARTAALYLPADTATGAEYVRWAEGTAPSDALNTGRSAKDFFFPQTENLMNFRMEGKALTVEDIRTESEDFVIYGMRACDVRSLEVLDRVFLAEPADTYYENRRRHAVILSMLCTRPAETCFCGTFGIDAAAPAGDIVCCKTADTLYLEPKTAKGEKLLSALEAVTEPADDTDCAAVETQRAQTRARLQKLPLADLSAQAFGAGKTAEYFDDPAWKTLSEACLGCGTCTFVCPTCQCYDIKEFDSGKLVRRFRCWDSCMYSDFTKMSAGQPRPTQLERFRQRFMHKLVYFPDNNEGCFGCVGCGRCLAKCPIHMNIVKVIKTLGEEHA